MLDQVFMPILVITAVVLFTEWEDGKKIHWKGALKVGSAVAVVVLLGNLVRYLYNKYIGIEIKIPLPFGMSEETGFLIQGFFFFAIVCGVCIFAWRKFSKEKKQNESDIK